MRREEWSNGKRVRYIIDEEEKTVVAVLYAESDNALTMFDSMLLRMLDGNQGGPVCPNDFMFSKKNYRLNRNIYRGKARCHPNDTFDVEFGKRLALLRAQVKYHMAIEKKLSDIWCFMDDLHDNFEKVMNKHYRKYLDICSDLYAIEKSVGA